MQPKSGTEGDSHTASAVTEWRSSQTAPHSWISIEINTIKPAAVDRIVLHVSDSDQITAARVYANDTRLVGQAEHCSNDICSVRWMVPVQSRRWRIEMRVPESGIAALRRVQLFAGAKECAFFNWVGCNRRSNHCIVQNYNTPRTRWRIRAYCVTHSNSSARPGAGQISGACLLPPTRCSSESLTLDNGQTRLRSLASFRSPWTRQTRCAA